MTDFMAQMLNELMGPSRNALPGEKVDLDYDHPDVCKDFLAGFCTYDSFRNTKNDMGFCPYSIHDESLRKKYQESNRKGRLGYEEKFLDRIRRLHNEVRRKIEKHEERLLMTQGETSSTNELYDRKKAELTEKRDSIIRSIEQLMDEAQKEGARGNVGAAESAVSRADELTQEKNALDEEEVKMEDEKQRAVLFEDAISQGNKQMQVCQVCGCFMLTNDAPQRIDDHLSGKLHIAYLRIQEQVDKMEQEREARRRSVKENSGDRDKERERRADRDKERERKRSRSRDRKRSRSRDRRDKERDRESRHHRESRDSDRDRRDRDRDREKEKYDKDRKRRY
ncbi:hypothetical protein WR25_07491 isoform B [Diploscapter pachys]|uniref:Uncharacterized protein n=1 Tax=Diploscapter pachys TaxID=2018661 RepID=A0A2A2JK80_9BILA|nr:hypothetical protein WR25_07491 isoform A [Diploscapter pachys]PAV62086.1 hypothetical protein WR25_07491 isoform B [Diploscapter pachys]